MNLVVLSLICWKAVIGDAEVLVLRDGMSEVSLLGYLDYLEDPQSEMSFESLRQDSVQQKFQSSRQHSLNWGLTKYPMRSWLFFRGNQRTPCARP